VIISASRRCDLPAFGLDGFLADLRAGFRIVPNPWDASKPRRVDLSREAVDCIVFWTRDPRPLLSSLGELEDLGYPFYVQLTITGYPESLEPGGVRALAACEAAIKLAAGIGPERLIWRYDPLVLAEPGLDRAFHEANFASLAARLSGAARTVTLSLLDEYRSTTSRLAKAGYTRVVYGSPRGAGAGTGGGAGVEGLPPAPWPGLLASLAGLARARGFEARACAEPWDLSPLGLARASCIDPLLVARIAGHKGGKGPAAGPAQGPGRDRGQRRDCGCAPSVDVGSYGPCPRACAYCYARR
jgi:hypothetical protein